MSEQKPAVLITGNTGLIGTAIAHRLASQYHVVGFDRSGGDIPTGADFIQVDLTSDAAVEDALRQLKKITNGKLASIIHLAAYYDFSGEPSPLYEELTVKGTERLLRGCKELAIQCEQFVFASTMLVHAPCEPGQHIDESWPLKPKWDYPKSKVQTENLLRRDRGSMQLAILRIAGVYDDHCHSIPIAHQIQRVYEKRMTGHVYPGNLDAGQAFVHLDDLVDALERTVARRQQLPPEMTLLIGEPDTIGYQELQEELGRLIHGQDWSTYRVPKIVAKAGAWAQEKMPGVEDPFIKTWMVDMADDHYALDIHRAVLALDWEPRHSLRDTLPAMIAALQADPVGWYRTNHLDPSNLSTKQTEASH